MITVFSKPGCKQCDLTKDVLQKRGISYISKDVSEDAEAFGTVRGLGYLSVPVVVVENGTTNDHWSGFRPDKLNEL